MSPSSTLACLILSIISFLSSLTLFLTLLICKALISRNKGWKFATNIGKKYEILTKYLFYLILCDCLFSLSLIIYFRDDDNISSSSSWQCKFISFLSQLSYCSLSIWSIAFIYALWRYSQPKKQRKQQNKHNKQSNGYNKAHSLRLLSNSEKYESFRYGSGSDTETNDYDNNATANISFSKYFPYLSRTQIRTHHIVIWLTTVILTCIPLLSKLIENDLVYSQDVFCWITDQATFFGMPFFWISAITIAFLFSFLINTHFHLLFNRNNIRNRDYYKYLSTYSWFIIVYIFCNFMPCVYNFHRLTDKSDEYLQYASNFSLSLFGLLNTIIWFNNHNIISMIKEILSAYSTNKSRRASISKMQSLSELYRLSIRISYKNDEDVPNEYEYDSDQHRIIMTQILNQYPPPKRESNVDTHPHDRANIFTEYTYFYMLPLMRKGYKKAIELTDLTLPPNCIQLEYLYDQFLRHYTPKYKEHCVFTFDVLRTVFRVNRWNVIKIIFCNVISELFEVGGVLAFRELVNFLYSSDPTYYGIILAVVIGLSKECAYIFTARGWILGDRAGIGARNLLMGLIFRKSLLIPQYALINDKDENLSTGQIVNTMSNDTERINSLFKLGIVAVGCSINIFICLSFMIWIIGVESLAGFAIGLLLVPFNIFFGKLIASIKLKALTFSDERVKFLTEILNGIRVIKMYCWEKVCELSNYSKTKWNALLYKTAITSNCS